MTRQQVKYYIPFMQAWADGKRVQWKSGTNVWEDIKWFNFPDFDTLTEDEKTFAKMKIIE